MAAMEGLSVGFRFHPTDVELVVDYLKPKVRGLPIEPDIIPVVDDLYKGEPWDLPGKSFMPSTDRREWYFFGPRDRKHPNGRRTNRATPKGHWKSTGKDRLVLQHNGSGAIVGIKKTLVYHEGRAPKGVRTDWVMHEYRLPDDSMAATMQVSSYALCRLLNKKAICTQTQVEVQLPSSDSEEMTPSAPVPAPEVPVAADNDVQVTEVPAPLPEVPVAADNDDQVPVTPWMNWIQDQLNSLDGGSWIDYYYAGCSGTEWILSSPGVTAAVADDDTDYGNINYSGYDQLILDDNDSWIDYFL